LTKVDPVGEHRHGAAVRDSHPSDSVCDFARAGVDIELHIGSTPQVVHRRSHFFVGLFFQKLCLVARARCTRRVVGENARTTDVIIEHGLDINTCRFIADVCRIGGIVGRTRKRRVVIALTAPEWCEYEVIFRCEIVRDFAKFRVRFERLFAAVVHDDDRIFGCMVSGRGAI
jgi:hypothetical protein